MTTASANTSRLAPPVAGFALAEAITALFNTALAWAKDASPPLLKFMNALAFHNWVTQGLADLVLFFGLGLLFWKSGLAARIAPNRMVFFVGAASVLAAVGLFAWYLLY